MRAPWRVWLALGTLALPISCAPVTEYDVLIRNGTIYDGSGSAPFQGDVAIRGDGISAVGHLENARGRAEIDARGLAVAPGFINILSWASDSLIEDGRSQSDIRQGVTLEVFGEGWSMGPVNDAMKKEMVERQGDIRYAVEWTTLGDYLDYLVKRGVAPNVASFVGATTVRIHVVGYEDRPPTLAELDEMRALVRQAMEEGALGVASSLIYAPAFYAGTGELVALAKVAAESKGLYISHIRSEGNHLLEASTSSSTSRAEPGSRRRSITSKRPVRRTGGSSRKRCRRSRGPGPMDCASRPTSIPTPRAGPGSTRRCRRGSRRVGKRHGSSG